MGECKTDTRSNGDFCLTHGRMLTECVRALEAALKEAKETAEGRLDKIKEVRSAYETQKQRAEAAEARAAKAEENEARAYTGQIAAHQQLVESEARAKALEAKGRDVVLAREG